MRAPSSRVALLRSLGFASVVLLAGCSYGGGVAPGGYVSVPLASANARPCASKAMTKELSNAQEFLARAMALHDLITSRGDTSRSSPMQTIQQQVQGDLVMYGQIANGRVSAGAGNAGGASAVAPGTPPTRDQMQQMQDAAWMQSGVTQAQVFVRQVASGLSSAPITTDVQKVYADIAGDGTGLQPDTVISDVQTFLEHIEAVVGPSNKLAGYRDADGSVPAPSTAAGALSRYLDPVLKSIHDATSAVQAFLDPSAIAQLKNNLTMLSQMRDGVGNGGNSGPCVGSP